VRDLDVTIEKLGHYLQTVPAEDQAGLTPLVEHWKLELEQARQEMIIHLNSQEYLDFKNNFSIFLNTPGMGKKKSEIHAPGGSNVRFLTPTLIYNRFSSVMAYDSVIPMASFEQLHALRIEFKRLRYTLEFFKEILGKDVQTIIEEIKGLQDHLGELNDANVACHTLSRFIKNWDKKQISLPLMERTNPLGIIHYLASRYAERHQLMITFPTAWQHFSRIELRQSLARSMAIL
jgi:CHAD domain-containing protein